MPVRGGPWGDSLRARFFVLARTAYLETKVAVIMALRDASTTLVDLPDVLPTGPSSYESWMFELREAFEAYAAEPSRGDATESQGPFASLLAPVLPLIQRGHRRLLYELENISNESSVDLVELAPLLLGHLLTHLSQLTVRTVVLEMHAAGDRGELKSATPGERFTEFTAQLQLPERAFELLAAYPALARQAVIATEQWLGASVEFAERLVRDGALLSEHFFGGRSLPRLVNIEAGAGDRHRGGRSVFVLQWSDGRRVLYKPRSLAVEAHFQDLVRWANERGAKPRLRTLEILDRGEYGWVEYVSHTGVSNHAAMQRFYRRQGAFLALVYLLSATDLHAENLLAAGEHPVLIDLEALFHHRLPGPRKDAAALGLTNSVLAIRMLPQSTYVDGFDDPIDFSGLGATAGQSTPFRASQWQNVGRDDMRLESLPVATPEGTHRPRLSGEEIDYRSYKSDLSAGFVDMYRILAARREELLSDSGPVAAFAHDPVRFIARPTQVYAILLERSFHPESLASPNGRQRAFRRLERQAGEFACLARLVPHEVSDLNRNDIPIFTTTPGGCELTTSAGEVLADFFPESAMKLVRQRILELGEADLARQLWLIDAAFAVSGRLPEAPKPRAETLQGALAIGDRFIELMQQTGDEVGWIGLHPRGRGWSIGAIGSDLLHGQAGVALFLGYLAEFTGAERFRDTSRMTARSIISRLGWDTEHAVGLAQLPQSGYVPHVLAELALLWSDEGLARDAGRLAELLGVRLPPGDLRGSFAAADRLVREALGALETRVKGMAGIDHPGLACGLAGEGWKRLAKAAGI